MQTRSIKSCFSGICFFAPVCIEPQHLPLPLRQHCWAGQVLELWHRLPREGLLLGELPKPRDVRLGCAACPPSPSLTLCYRGAGFGTPNSPWDLPAPAEVGDTRQTPEMETEALRCPFSPVPAQQGEAFTLPGCYFSNASFLSDSS